MRCKCGHPEVDHAPNSEGGREFCGNRPAPTYRRCSCVQFEVADGLRADVYDIIEGFISGRDEDLRAMMTDALVTLFEERVKHHQVAQSAIQEIRDFEGSSSLRHPPGSGKSIVGRWTQNETTYAVAKLPDVDDASPEVIVPAWSVREESGPIRIQQARVRNGLVEFDCERRYQAFPPSEARRLAAALLAAANAAEGGSE